MGIRGALATAVVAACLLVVAGTATAAPGDRDPSWGRHGLVKDKRARFWSPEVASDGSVAVLAALGGARNPTYEVRRLTESGRPDVSFARDGSASLDPSFRPWDMAMQADGRLIVAGVTESPDPPFATLTVIRLNPDGQPDPTFGSGGARTFSSLTNPLATPVAVAPDGRVAVGIFQIAGEESAVLRLLPDGSPDPSFDGDGISGHIPGGLETLTVDGQGRYLAGGQSAGSGFTVQGQVARLDSDGHLDSTFGTGGLTRFGIGGESASNAGLAVDAAGRVITASYRWVHLGPGYPTPTLLRLATDGTLDGGFDPAFSPQISDLALDASGRVVLTGSTDVEGLRTGRSDPFVDRLMPDGAADTTFGGDGKVVVPSIEAGTGSFGGIAIAPDGRIVTTGDRVIARLLVGAGKSDADADGLLGRLDDCPLTAGKRKQGGCPLLEQHVELQYLPDIGFRGTVRSEPQCLQATSGSRTNQKGVSLTLRRRQAGPDKLIARTRVDPEDGEWEAGTPVKPGRYYAAIGRHRDGRLGICPAAESRNYHVKPY